MGYFPNGSSSVLYWEKYCARCIHNVNEYCPVWAAHLMHNYEECSKEDNILHMLIPISEDGLGNEKCKMFIEDPNADQMGLFEE